MVDLVAMTLIATGLVFFIAGSLGMVRLPDLFSRLHALTKADNVGLGLVCLGVALHLGSLAAAAKLFVIWLLALVSAAAIAQLLAARVRSERER
ncbi:MAG: monovalent cation/H(+) antiporter subunit G [Geminicoccaceae bacterium]|nr:MAG: monovalent cation/H(+) antiporter subunit G [Geminicoccaceae bacterium]